jgi:hypothetical protein
MRKAIGTVLVVALAASSAAAATWDFDDGTWQGWTPQVRNAGNLQDASFAPSIGVDPLTGSNAVHMHSNRDLSYGSNAYIPLADFGADPTNSFHFSADFSYMDLRALWNCGLQYTYEGTSPGLANAWLQGRADDNTQGRDRIQFKDTHSPNSHTQEWEDAFRILSSGDFNNGPARVHMDIDYNYSTPGKIVLSFMSYDYESVLAGGQNVMWTAEYDRDPSLENIHGLMIGGDYGHFEVYIDNVSFVPEPASALLLLAPMAFIRRRRQG